MTSARINGEIIFYCTVFINFYFLKKWKIAREIIYIVGDGTKYGDEEWVDMLCGYKIDWVRGEIVKLSHFYNVKDIWTDRIKKYDIKRYSINIYPDNITNIIFLFNNKKINMTHYPSNVIHKEIGIYTKNYS